MFESKGIMAYRPYNWAIVYKGKNLKKIILTQYFSKTTELISMNFTTNVIVDLLYYFLIQIILGFAIYNNGLFFCYIICIFNHNIETCERTTSLE